MQNTLYYGMGSQQQEEVGGLSNLHNRVTKSNFTLLHSRDLLSHTLSITETYIVDAIFNWTFLLVFLTSSFLNWCGWPAARCPTKVSLEGIRRMVYKKKTPNAAVGFASWIPDEEDGGSSIPPLKVSSQFWYLSLPAPPPVQSFLLSWPKG